MKESSRSRSENMAGDVKIFGNSGTYSGGLRDISVRWHLGSDFNPL